MNIDIEKAIREQLPSAVGDVLQARLAQLTDLENRLSLAGDKISALGASLKRSEERNALLEERLASLDRLKQLEPKLNAKDIELGIKEQVLAVRQECADARVKDMKELVSLVFQNNRYKYQDFYSNCTPTGSFTTNKSGESQG